MFIQADWDYPGVASTFGWSPCCGSTDGTIDCPEHGTKVLAMIEEAREHLDDVAGFLAVDDPGYFEED